MREPSNVRLRFGKMRDSRALLVVVLTTVSCANSQSDSFGPSSATLDSGFEPNLDSGIEVPSQGSQGFGAILDGGRKDTCVEDAANFDVPGNGCDDDGDGVVDNVTHCDSGIVVTGDANAFAKALGICKTLSSESEAGWGLLSAEFTDGFGKSDPPPMQHGILPKFGKVLKPTEGNSLGVLSTGYAREYNGTRGVDAFKDGQTMQPNIGAEIPPGYPKSAANCPAADSVNDVVGVKLRFRVPRNAKGIRFEFNFHSGEWPEYVCTRFNDGFVAMLSSKAFNGGVPENISFDSLNNPVSVNNAFFDRCTPQSTVGCQAEQRNVAACPGGTSELGGTGFGEPERTYCGFTKSVPGGATGWLRSQAPLEPGEVATIQFIIWDTGDHNYDSSVLLDNMTFEPLPVEANTVRPPH